jgi:cytochrome c
MTPQGFELNKIAGAVLFAGFVAMTAGLISEALYTGGIGEHEDHNAKRGYTIAGAEMVGDAHAAPVDTGPVDIAPFMAKADAKAGETVVKKCTSCHTFDKGGKHGVGPNQWGLVGSHFAHAGDYKYSDALLAMKDKKWGNQELSDFLANPKKFIPGNKMSFAGIKDPQDRANLIAYLATLK